MLDELPEFDARSLEVLRQPMEDKLVTISRASGSLTFPSNFQLIAAMNPCKCGWYGDPVKPCTCSPGSISQVQKRISGPLLDHPNVQRRPGRGRRAGLLRAGRRRAGADEGGHRVLKLARTIADLAGNERITTTHLAEALQYRPRRQEM